MNRIDELGRLFAEECQEADLVGFAIRTTAEGNVRFIGLSLPPALVAQLLRTAADAYEQQVPSGAMN